MQAAHRFWAGAVRVVRQPRQEALVQDHAADVGVPCLPEGALTSGLW